MSISCFPPRREAHFEDRWLFRVIHYAKLNIGVIHQAPYDGWRWLGGDLDYIRKQVVFLTFQHFSLFAWTRSPFWGEMATPSLLRLSTADKNASWHLDGILWPRCQSSSVSVFLLVKKMFIFFVLRCPDCPTRPTLSHFDFLRRQNYSPFHTFGPLGCQNPSERVIQKLRTWSLQLSQYVVFILISRKLSESW